MHIRTYMGAYTYIHIYAAQQVDKRLHIHVSTHTYTRAYMYTYTYTSGTSQTQCHRGHSRTDHISNSSRIILPFIPSHTTPTRRTQRSSPRISNAIPT